MSSPKISIVIPVYSPNRYLNEVLQSVRDQTYKDYEVVISDDTPNEEAAQNIISLFEDLPIHYLRNQTGKGIFNNLNNAIQNSRGNLIQIFCQDDVMKPHFLAEQMNIFESYPNAGLVFCGLDEIDDDGNFVPSIPYFTDPPKNWSTLLQKPKALNHLFAFGCIPRNLSPVMLRRKVVERIGFFRQEFSFAGDFEYWIRVAEEYDFVVNKLSLIQVRSHKQRATNTIGLMRSVPEATTLLRTLYFKNTVAATKNAKRLQVNNLVVSHFKEILLQVFAGRFRYLSLLKYLQSPPFSIPTILFLILQRYYKRKVSWFISAEQC